MTSPNPVQASPRPMNLRTLALLALRAVDLEVSSALGSGAHAASVAVDAVGNATIRAIVRAKYPNQEWLPFAHVADAVVDELVAEVPKMNRSRVDSMINFDGAVNLTGRIKRFVELLRLGTLRCS